MKVAGGEVISAKDLRNYSVVTEGKAVQRYPLFCSLDMPIAGVTELPFFSTAVGGTQTVGATAITMNAARTNITKANAIATPNDFILKAIRLAIFPRVAETTKDAAGRIDDMLLVWEQGYFKLEFGERVHLTCPIWMLSAGAGVSGWATDSSGESHMIVNDHPLIFRIEPWLAIPSELNFKTTLNWTTAPNVAAVCRFVMVLDGDLIRNVS